MSGRCLNSHAYWCALTLLLTGCTSRHYEITLTPQGEQIERRLSVQQTAKDDADKNPVSQHELQILSRAYSGKEPERVDKRLKWVSQFADRMPQDVGGHGEYRRYGSPLGVVTLYMERFRGSYDLMEELEARRQSIDRVLGLLMRWLKSRGELDAATIKLLAFLDGPFRRDLENLSHISYMSDMHDQSNSADPHQWLMNVWQFLIEKSYVTPADLPALTRGWDDFKNRSQDQRLGVWLRQLLARKLSLSEAEQASHAWLELTTPAKAEASLLAFLKQSPEFAEEQRQSTSENTLGQSDAWMALTIPLGRALSPPAMLRGSDEVTLSLKTGRQPFQTNGEWEEETQTIDWSLRIEGREVPRGHEFPKTCFAIWVEPDKTLQTKHFGKVVLDQESLFQFNLWYQGLSPEEAVQWDAFVADLRPDDGLLARLLAFRFSGEPPAEPWRSADNIVIPDDVLASRALYLLVSALQK